MHYLRCLLPGVLAAEFGIAASLVNLDPSFNISTPANLTISDALNASIALNVSTALNISTALNASNPARKPFNELVSEGYLSTIISYHGAILLEVQATPFHRPVKDPASLKDVRLLFSYGSHKSIYREMKEWGIWGSPRPMNIAPPENDGPLPFEIDLDIIEASQLIRQARFYDKYEAVDVRLPTDVPAGMQQVYYIFSMVGDGPSEIAVGVRNHDVVPKYAVSIGDGWLSGNGSSTN